jgi:hypothetical protein
MDGLNKSTVVHQRRGDAKVSFPGLSLIDFSQVATFEIDSRPIVVIPAKAGIHLDSNPWAKSKWIPA